MEAHNSRVFIGLNSVTELAKQSEINSLKTSVSNGKSLIASAITGKGVSTSSTATFQTMANNISSLAIRGTLAHEMGNQEGNTYWFAVTVPANYPIIAYHINRSSGTSMHYLISISSASSYDIILDRHYSSELEVDINQTGNDVTIRTYVFSFSNINQGAIYWL